MASQSIEVARVRVETGRIASAELERWVGDHPCPVPPGSGPGTAADAERAAQHLRRHLGELYPF